MAQRMRRLLLLALLGGACQSAPVKAASLQISPVIVTLAAGQSAAYLLLENTTQQALFGQVRVFDWDQGLNEEKLSPAQDLVASPPVLEIGAGRKQLVRLVRIDPSPRAAERAYRLLIDEIPSTDEERKLGVAVRLRYSVPVFIAPETEGKPVLRWRLRREPDGAYLEVQNEGGRRAQIAAVELLAGRERYSVDAGLLGYALARHTRRWKLPVAASGAPGRARRVRALVNGRHVEAELTAPAPP
jgi:fimbrial chaperone protein